MNAQGGFRFPCKWAFFLHCAGPLGGNLLPSPGLRWTQSSLSFLPFLLFFFFFLVFFFVAASSASLDAFSAAFLAKASASSSAWQNKILSS